MDLILVLLTVACITVYRSYKYGSVSDDTPVMLDDGSISMGDVQTVPVGSNLMMNIEHGAFTKILKEFDLVQ